LKQSESAVGRRESKGLKQKERLKESAKGLRKLPKSKLWKRENRLLK
jgi:hypothetical protein